MNPIDTLENALHTDAVLSVEDTARLRDLSAALDARALAAYQDSTCWSDDGHTSPTAGVRYACNQSTGSARARLRLARSLGEFDHIRDALEVGDIGLDAVHALLRHDTDALHDQLLEDQKHLVEQASELEYPDLVAELAQWARDNDTDGADQDAAQQHESRAATRTKTAGRCRIEATLPGLGGIEWAIELDRIEQELFQADWADARARLGEKATKHDLRRTKDQRSADAMIEMARRSSEYRRTMADEEGNVPAAPRAKVTVNLVMGYETFLAELAKLLGNPIPYPETRLCEFENGTPVAPSEALDLAIAGEVRRVVFGAEGHVLDFGRKQRLFTGALAEAIKLRDRTCQHPGCGVPSTKCQVDHVQEHQHGGETKESNGEPLCGTHNRWKTNHQQHYRDLKARHRRRFKRRGPPSP